MQGVKNLAPMCLSSQKVTAGCAPPKRGHCQEGRHGIWETRNGTQERGEGKCDKRSQDVDYAMNTNKCASRQPIGLQAEDRSSGEQPPGR